MKISIGHYFGISLQLEILFLTACGIFTTMFDESLSDLSTNLQEIWRTDFPKDDFSAFQTHIMKFLISGVVVVRSFTLHLYLAFYLVMIWPAIFVSTPSITKL